MSRGLVAFSLVTLAAIPAHADTTGRATVFDGDTIEIRGEHIYHVPGGRWYDRTRISPDRGERWFCTEAEAREAGWRAARESMP